MFNIGPMELVVLAIVGVIVIGPGPAARPGPRRRPDDQDAARDGDRSTHAAARRTRPGVRRHRPADLRNLNPRSRAAASDARRRRPSGSIRVPTCASSTRDEEPAASSRSARSRWPRCDDRRRAGLDAQAVPSGSVRRRRDEACALRRRRHLSMWIAARLSGRGREARASGRPGWSGAGPQARRRPPAALRRRRVRGAERRSASPASPPSRTRWSIGIWPEQRHLRPGRRSTASRRPPGRRRLPNSSIRDAVGQLQPAHVLDHADDLLVGLQRDRPGPLGDLARGQLRRGDHEQLGGRHELGHRDRDVAGARAAGPSAARPARPRTRRPGTAAARGAASARARRPRCCRG